MNAIQVLEQVQRKNYDLAENQILRGTHDPYLLSLIYRLQDKYEAERNLLDAIGPGETANGYFTERKRWLDSPIRQRCESRPPLHLPTSPGSVPSKSTLDQLCFVSAGDSKYFDLLVEMLESLKSTRIYGNTPINLIDCGLSAQEKHYLLGNFPVQEIKPPAWELPTQQGEVPAGLEAMAVRAFLPMNFPGYGYYFWIDADAWIQDERFLAGFIDHAESLGLGISCSSPAAVGKSFFTQITERNTLEFIDPVFHHFDLFKSAGGVSVGAFCIRADSPVDTLWREVMTRNTGARGFHFYSDTDSCTIAALLENIPTLSFEHHCHNSLQLENGVFYYRDSPVGIVALPAGVKWRRYTSLLDSKDTERSRALLAQLKPAEQEAFQSIKKSLLAYRTLPWRDKPAIEALLCDALADSNT